MQFIVPAVLTRPGGLSASTALGSEQKRDLIRIEYAKGGDRSSTIRRTLPERSANDPRPPPAPSKAQQRADAAAAFIAWRATQAAEPQ
jgi:hypothetical protein